MITHNIGSLGGDQKNWEKDLTVYESTKNSFDKIIFSQSLGVGHDFGGQITLDFAEKKLGSRKGSFSWNGIEFIWISGNVSAFSNDPSVKQEGFYDGDLLWLDSVLSRTGSAVLLCHVPIRTELTFNAGDWPGNTNLTIPADDNFYKIIDKHARKIQAIFNGHIHNLIKTGYKSTPVYLCGFHQNGYYYIISISNGRLNIDSKFFKRNN